MKWKGTTLLLIIVLLALLPFTVLADKPIKTDSLGNEIAWENTKLGCTKIQDGVLTYSSGHYLDEDLLEVGFDPYGYNYQGHFFKGSYANVYLGGDGFPPYDGDDEAYLAENPTVVTHWAWPYREVRLEMKWNDAWIANTDCDGDGSLDRHYGYPTYIGSGAWETNHQSGEYELNGQICQWNYFVKIVAVPAEAMLTDDIWYNAEGIEIGPDIWGQFAIIQQVENDPCAGIHGLQYSSPDHNGFGGW